MGGSTKRTEWGKSTRRAGVIASHLVPVAPSSSVVVNNFTFSSISFDANRTPDVPVNFTLQKVPNEAETVHLRLQVPNISGIKRIPSDIVCVIDISGSMSSVTEIKNADGNVESHGFSSLDIVKHAVRTLAHSMTGRDRLALVVFSNSASIPVELKYMGTDEAKQSLEATLDLLHPNGSTNLWDGLRIGASILNNNKEEGRFSSIFLLTDGYANISPPRGEIEQFRHLIKTTSPNFSLNTFGFGYEIESNLLYDLAVEGNGMFSFIPDASMVGTVFVNSIANAFCSLANNSSIDIPEAGCSLRAETLQIGQAKDFIVKTSDEVAYYNYQLLQSKQTSRVQSTIVEDLNDTEFHQLRLEAIDTIIRARNINKKRANALDMTQKWIDKVIAKIKKARNPDTRSKSLLEDLEGQVTIALSNYSFFVRWGQHYLLSLARAHELQLCSNFKDPGVQAYGGTLFNSLREEVEQIYMKLPPPKPSQPVRNQLMGGMGDYYDVSRPCFAGECEITMADGSIRLVKDIKRGDKVKTPGGKSAEVQCVVQTLNTNGTAELCSLSPSLFATNISSSPFSSFSSLSSLPPLLITPYHPVRVSGEWYFPNTLVPSRSLSCNSVFSFLLQSEHIMFVNGIECVTLGHEFHDNEIIKHEYFGSRKVVEDLMKFSGWKSGKIVLGEGCLVRDSESGRVCGLKNEISFYAA